VDKAIPYTIASARTGSPTLIIKKDGKDFPLHSTVDPRREATAFTDRFNPEKYDTLIVLGLGLGYHLFPLKSIIERYKSVFLIDLLENLGDAIIKTENSFLVKNSLVRIISGKSPESVAETLTADIDLSATKGISVLEHPASMRLFPEYYHEIKKQIESLIDKKAGNEATKKAFGLKYAKNILRNTSYLPQTRPVSELFGRFTAHPVLVITSGPSVDSIWEKIRGADRKVFIIAVDSALAALYARNIIPDFMVCIDPQPYIYEHLQGIDPAKSIPVLSVSASPLAFAWAGPRLRQGGDVFFALNTHPLSQVIESLFGVAASIESGTGNVAGDAVNLALAMGFEKIFLAGFDFSFPRFSIYARGTAYQRRYSLYFQDRFTTVEGKNTEYIFNSSKKYRFEDKYTRRVFIQYRESLERLIAPFTRTVSSLTSSGLTVSGVSAADGDILKQFPELDKSAIIADIIGKNRGNIAFKPDQLKAALNDGAVFTGIAEASLSQGHQHQKLKKLIQALL